MCVFVMTAVNRNLLFRFLTRAAVPDDSHTSCRALWNAVAFRYALYLASALGFPQFIPVEAGLDILSCVWNAR